MHDGRFETLEQVIEHYSSGIQRRATLAPNLSKHPAGGLQLSTSDQAALGEKFKDTHNFRRCNINPSKHG